MIVETGYLVDENDPERMERSRRQLARTIREAINNTDGHCKGVFYWETLMPRVHEDGLRWHGI